MAEAAPSTSVPAQAEVDTGAAVAAPASSDPTNDAAAPPVVRADKGGSTSPSAKEPAILLYYCYTPNPLPSVPFHVSFQRELCESLHLNGRIRVSPEGINGVLSAHTRADLEEYVRRVMRELGDGVTEEEFDAKYCRLRQDLGVEEQMFGGLSVKSTREVVSLWEPGAEEQREMAKAKAKARRLRRRDEKMAEKQGGGGGENGGDASSNGASSECQVPCTVPTPPNGMDLEGYEPALHLSPEEWNESLISRVGSGEEAILIDARNVYESRVGHFRVPGVATLLTNTRKYSSLPAVLEAHKSRLAGKHVYMYCTGGVRCERASTYLQALSDGDGWSAGEDGGMEKPKGVYQLKGGVQRYLEKFGHPERGSTREQVDDFGIHQQSNDGGDPCLYKGKNFVFDQRRTDPIIGGSEPVGQCILCEMLWDDYDNGSAPCENRETRCRRCRILVLICGECRGKVRAWGENDEDSDENLPELFCGAGGKLCVDQGNSADAVEIIKGSPT